MSVATDPAVRRRAAVALAGATAALALVAAVYLFVERVQLLFYPTVAVLFAAVAYLAGSSEITFDYDALLGRLPESRVLDIGLSASIVAVVALSRLQPVGLHAAFYWFLPVVTLLFALRIFRSPSRLTLVQLVLFAVAVRAAIWFSAPVVGVDSRFHVALVRFVTESGTAPPDSLSYYSWYPMAHVAAGAVSELSLASPERALFLVTGAYAGVSVAAVYLLADALVGPALDGDDRVRAALLAALVVAVGPWHVRRTGVVIAQSMGVAALPFALYAAVRIERRAYAVLFALLAGVIAFTHNLTPVVLAFVLFALAVGARLAEWAAKYVPDWRPVPVTYGLPLVFATGALTVQYWLYIDYFDLQVYRVVALVFRFGSDAVGGGGGLSLGAELAFTLRDPFVYVGIEQLVFGAALVLFGFVALGGLGRGTEGLPGDVTGIGPVPFGPFLAALAVFGAFSSALATGQHVNAARVLAGPVVIVAPMVGFLACRSYETGSLAALAVVGLLVALPVSGGVAALVGTVSPAVSPTEEVGAPGYATDQELAGADHLLGHRSPAGTYFADEYVAGAVNYRAVAERGLAGVQPAATGIPLMNAPDRVQPLGPSGTANRSEALSTLRETPERYYLDDRRRSPPRLRPLPGDCSVVYDAGHAEVVTC